ncbi:unnamed protein product [Closterium sp. NIES-64]|nr:unnamed protein product [Closterium sp. NIES-64]
MSFRGGGTAGGSARKGPQYVRHIPKFLQKYEHLIGKREGQKVLWDAKYEHLIEKQKVVQKVVRGAVRYSERYSRLTVPPCSSPPLQKYEHLIEKREGQKVVRDMGGGEGEGEGGEGEEAGGGAGGVGGAVAGRQTTHDDDGCGWGGVVGVGMGMGVVIGMSLQVGGEWWGKWWGEFWGEWWGEWWVGGVVGVWQAAGGQMAHDDDGEWGMGMGVGIGWRVVGSDGVGNMGGRVMGMGQETQGKWHMARGRGGGDMGGGPGGRIAHDDDDGEWVGGWVVAGDVDGEGEAWERGRGKMVGGRVGRGKPLMMMASGAC